MHEVDVRGGHDEVAIFPATHRMTQRRRHWLTRLRLIRLRLIRLRLHVNHAHEIVFLDAQMNLVSPVDKLEGIGIRHDHRHALRGTARDGVVGHGVVGLLCRPRGFGQWIAIFEDQPDTDISAPDSEYSVC